MTFLELVSQDVAPDRWAAARSWSGSNQPLAQLVVVAEADQLHQAPVTDVVGCVWVRDGVSAARNVTETFSVDEAVVRASLQAMYPGVRVRQYFTYSHSGTTS